MEVTYAIFLLIVSTLCFVFSQLVPTFEFYQNGMLASLMAFLLAVIFLVSYAYRRIFGKTNWGIVCALLGFGWAAFMYLGTYIFIVDYEKVNELISWGMAWGFFCLICEVMKVFFPNKP